MELQGEWGDRNDIYSVSEWVHWNIMRFRCWRWQGQTIEPGITPALRSENIALTPFCRSTHATTPRCPVTPYFCQKPANCEPASSCPFPPRWCFQLARNRPLFPSAIGRPALEREGLQWGWFVLFGHSKDQLRDSKVPNFCSSAKWSHRW